MEAAMKNLVHLLYVSLLVFTSVTAGEAALGSQSWQPTVDHPTGWRGDGTGRFPGAIPPTSWSRTKNGNVYTVKNILWAAPLPNIGVSCPVIVGDKIFLTTEVCDLVCLDKNSGRVLWIRSNPEFEALSDEDKKAFPAIADKLVPLLPQLAKANTDAAEALNAHLASGATSAYPAGVSAKKKELEKKISDEQLALDKKKFERYWAQGVFGFAGQTPTSDGKHVCAFFTTGVSCCYDLDGNRKWIARGSGGGSEHGNFASPLLCGGKLVVWANELRAYDVESGKLAWSNSAKGSNNYGSLFRVQLGNDLIAGFQFGYFARVSDGKPIWGDGVFGNAIETPIVEAGTIFATMGYPRVNDQNSGLKAFKIPASDSAKLTPAYPIKTEWAADEIPVEKDKSPFARGYCASPLYVDGLLYRMTEAGGLIVNDAASGEIVYRKVLPMKPRTAYWNWAGASASPTLAGKYIYLMDNQGKTVIIEPGKQYKEVAQNTLEEAAGNEQAQTLSTPIFEGTRMYYRTPGYLYCIGEK
jgi:outer membrane protein assembly factor BamB